MWTITAVNKKFNGPLGTYNGLTDVHLAHYFSRPHKRSHLKTAKLITTDGVIIPEQKVRVQCLQFEKKRKVYDILAAAVIQNAVHKEGTWNKQLCSYLEDISKMEIVERIKDQYFKKRIFPCSHHSTNNCAAEKRRHNLKKIMSAKDYSPYVVPLLLYGSSKHRFQNVMQQIITSKKKKKKNYKKSPTFNQMVKNAGLNFTSKMGKLTAFDQQFKANQCKITLYYFGNSPLTNCNKHVKQDIVIKQQHCGGTPVVVCKGNIAPNETVTFISLDHDGFSFSLMVFLDGIRDLKLSTCCVFRYSPGRRLGGPSGTFAIQKIEGGKRCLKCEYREIELSSKCMKNKPVCAENNLTKNRSDASDVLPLKEEKIETRNDSVIEDNENDDRDSVGSEDIIKSTDEEIEEISDTDHVQEDTVNEVLREENIEEANFDSFEEIKDTDKSSKSNSSIASAIENSENFVEIQKFQEMSIDSESSSDEEVGKQHTVLATVHGSSSP